MIPIWERRYRATAERVVTREFRCACCGHEDELFVRARAVASAGAVYGIGAGQAQRSANEKARERLEAMLKGAADRASCPRCCWARARRPTFLRAHGRAIALWLGLPPLIGLAYAALPANDTGFPYVALGLFVGAVGGVYQLLERRAQHRRGERDIEVAFASEVDEEALELAVEECLRPGAVPRRVASSFGVPLPMLLDELGEHPLMVERAELARLQHENRALRAAIGGYRGSRGSAQ